MTTKALAKTQKPKNIAQLLNDADTKEQLALAMPKHVDKDRWNRIALTCVRKNPKLMRCDPLSLLARFMDLSSLGLEPDGRMAHLIPFKDEVTLIIDFKGIVDIVRRSGEVDQILADVICENDEFDYQKGTGAFLKHKVDLKNKDGRGEVIGAYSFVKLKDGSEDFDVMTRSEIDKVRQASKTPDKGPWKDWFEEMAKKTVFRRHSKWLPFSPELKDKIEIDHTDALTDEERFKTSKTVGPAEPEIHVDFTEAPPSGEEGDQPEPPPEPDQTPGEDINEDGKSSGDGDAPLEIPAVLTTSDDPGEIASLIYRALDTFGFTEDQLIESAKDMGIATAKHKKIEQLATARLQRIATNFDAVCNGIKQ